jgi:hypothetical protein
VAVNARGDAFEGPEFIAEALSASPLAQEADELLTLFQTEFWLTATRMRFGIEPRCSMLRHGITPPSDGTGGGLDVAGHVMDAPARLQQGDGDAASHFELDGCAFGSHETLIGNTDLGL